MVYMSISKLIIHHCFVFYKLSYFCYSKLEFGFTFKKLFMEKAIVYH